MYSHLIFWRPLLVAILLFSGSVNADTYPAAVYYGSAVLPASSGLQASPDGVCGAIAALYSPLYPTYSVDLAGWRCEMQNSSGIAVSFPTFGRVLRCPAGGIVSGENCIDAPACPDGQNRNTVTQQCQVSPVCNNGETYNQGTNECTTNECPDGQTYQSSAANPTGGCVPIPGACDSTSTLICSDTPVICLSVTGYMQSKSLPRCSPISCVPPLINNATNDGCITPPPYVCPPGQHANAQSNGCDADTIAACPENSYSGTVNGQRVCIPSASNPNPVDNNNPTPPIPSINTGASQTHAVTTSTTTNPDGTQSYTTQTTDSNQKIELNTTGLAQDSTLKSINDSINKPSSKTAFSSNQPGTAPADTMLAQIDAKKLELQALMTNIKGQFNGMTPTFSGGSGISCGSGIHIPSLNININFCPDEQLAQYLPLIGNAIYFLAAFAALVILLA